MRTDFWIRNKIMPRNHDIAELRRLDIAHHLPAQADWAEIESLGGSRIITHAEGCYIHDGDGHRILDGMAGLWCVNVRSEEHTSELQSLMRNSYAVFCLKKKTKQDKEQ